MRTILSWMVLTICCLTRMSAQEGHFGQPVIAGYHPSAEKINDLVHTILDVSFDYKKCYLYGKEWITLRPYFYQTDSLRLDAKGMDIKEIALVSSAGIKPLAFTYDSLSVFIRLDRIYKNTEKYIVYIEYVARPKEVPNRAKNEKGLYFINPDSSEKNKPVQIWTEGEPESASVWFPTIDKPNQKTTAEISIRVPAKYVTLSNGRLASQKTNRDGTRTDTWKMEQPNSPYLFMMAVGDFSIYHDHWHGKEVNYYLEPAYVPFAKANFGQTPEAIDFFSKLLGVDFPWNKYSQVVVRDYVSGAMENTTAAVFGSQSTARELLDSYYNTGIEHELFHQWFGDYVTTESWSNLTLNESFADLGEILWLEHKYGKDAADEHLYQGLQGYLNNPDNVSKPLVKFRYGPIKDVFNGVTYQKGGRILNMLRSYLGKEAFYKGLHIYLTTNAYKSAEAQQLRLAMEEASGRDLNWFFNQWYYGAGHPVLDITYHWDGRTGLENVYIRQTQDGDAFILPLAVDIYVNGSKQRHEVWLYTKSDTLTFHTDMEPQLVNVDADKVLVGVKKDNKTAGQYFFQFFNAPLFMDRLEAMEAAAGMEEDEQAQKVIVAALTDRYSGIRYKALEILNREHEDIRNLNQGLRQKVLPVLVRLASTDSNTQVRAGAIRTLISLKDRQYMPIFIDALRSPSYEVEGSALMAIGQIDSVVAMNCAKRFEHDNRGMLTQAIAHVYAVYGGAEQWDFVFTSFVNGSLQDKIHLTSKISQIIGRIEDPVRAQAGIRELKLVAIKYKKDGAGGYVQKFLQVIKEQRAARNDAASAEAAAEAIKEIEDAP